VATVDSFQGREAEAVVISMVRPGPPPTPTPVLRQEGAARLAPAVVWPRAVRQGAPTCGHCFSLLSLPCVDMPCRCGPTRWAPWASWETGGA